MQVNTERIIPIVSLQKELSAKLSELSDGEEPFFVMRNNRLAAVIVFPTEYELLKDAEEILEHLEISDTVEKRLRTHDRAQNIPWNNVEVEHGLSS